MYILWKEYYTLIKSRERINEKWDLGFGSLGRYGFRCKCGDPIFTNDPSFIPIEVIWMFIDFLGLSKFPMQIMVNFGYGAGVFNANVMFRVVWMIS